MTLYYRPVVRFGGMPRSDSFPLAGGLCWFDEVVVHQRGKQSWNIPAVDLPDQVLERLRAPRADVAGLGMARPRVMGILNVTPDSFSDGGAYLSAEKAVSHALGMKEAGADILDIGGESTRPGATEVPVAEEISRTVPVIAAVRGETDIPISIDTRKSAVATAALAVGADLVNDVSAFQFDPAMQSVCAAAKVPVCLMHAQGTPETMQQDPRYDDVLLDVYDALEARVAAAEAAGIDRAKIVVDPGIGFGKTLQHNLSLLRGIAMFHALGCPILLGASRKRMIQTLGGGTDAVDRLGGSVAIALHGARHGVQILRVHDIFETKQALQLQWAIDGEALI